MRTIRQYFPVMLFITLCKVVVTFESVNETVVVQANKKLLPVVQSNLVNTDTEGAIYRTCLYQRGVRALSGFCYLSQKPPFIRTK